MLTAITLTMWNGRTVPVPAVVRGVWALHMAVIEVAEQRKSGRKHLRDVRGLAWTVTHVPTGLSAVRGHSLAFAARWFGRLCQETPNYAGPGAPFPLELKLELQSERAFEPCIDEAVLYEVEEWVRPFDR